ncbi:PucR family transcriptional regulator [Nocardia brasiliensis]
MSDRTEPNARSFPFAQYLSDRLPEITQAAMDAMIKSVPAYQHLPPELLETGLREGTSTNLELFVKSLTEGREPREAELEVPIAIAVRRAHDGVPLDAVLAVYHSGAATAWDIMAEAATSQEQREQLLAAVPHVLRYLGTVIPGVAGSYLLERQDLRWEHREAKRALAQALLQGNPSRLLAERFSIPLSRSYHLVNFRVTEPTASPTHQPLLRIVQAAVDEIPDALTTLERAGGTVLVPVRENDSTEDLDHLIASIAADTGLRTVAGVTLAITLDEVPARAAEAGEITQLAYSLGRPTGTYTMKDVALQYLLARPGPVHAWLLTLLTPLADHAHLMEALRSFIEHDYSRQETADSLLVHRNTLNYRLGRIAHFTGYDPNSPQDAQLLAAALNALDLERHAID